MVIFLNNKSVILNSLLVLTFICGINTLLIAQNHQPRFSAIDVRHYKFEIELNDSTDIIQGKTTVQVRFLKPVKKFYLDFQARNDSTNTGMSVFKIYENDIPAKYCHSEKKLNIQLNIIPYIGEIKEYSINYSGIPKDGLIISENKFGKRTFFGDNWPNRAFHWLPVVDHPSDKATVEFIVTAPEHYQVVSNGIQTEESNIYDGYKLTHWEEEIPVATKVMVIGVARFAVKQVGKVNQIPVSTWVFPENKESGFTDFSIALDPLAFFSGKIGEYPYKKLANVQSKTRYGGMENANCIFYNERTVTGKKIKKPCLPMKLHINGLGIL